MRTMTMTAALLAGLAMFPAAAAAQDKTADEAAMLWRSVRTADLDSPQFEQAQKKLRATLESLSGSKRTSAAAAMMDRYAGEAVNSAAVELLGADPLPITDVQRILWDEERTWGQRELIKTYYDFCRCKAKGSVVSDATCGQLISLLADRVDKLTGQKVAYGEQRLLTHLCMSVLARCGGDAEPSQLGTLAKSMAKYAEKAGGLDPLGTAFTSWIELRKSKNTASTFAEALQALGHWDAVMRLQAVALLAEEVTKDEKAAQVVLNLCDNPHEEARASAIRVFAFARSYKPDVVVPLLVTILTEGEGIVVQAAAADALIARADQTVKRIDVLLDAIAERERLAGALRTSSILQVLSQMAPYASEKQRERIMAAAVRNLQRSPDGALTAMAALGEQARPAVPSIRDYRSTADRFRRAQIDRHVLPAIQPDLPRKN